MANDSKNAFLNKIRGEYGNLLRLPYSNSLFEIENSSLRLYIRYSKLHKNRTFYGLRKTDLQMLEGHPSILCFLWDDQTVPLLMPYSDYEQVFQSLSPAGDGQYKVQLYFEEQGVQLYIPRAGRFSVDDHLGWDALTLLVDKSNYQRIPDLSHSQIQTLLGAIGVSKGYDIWVPPIDRTKLDWTHADRFICKEELPNKFESIRHILQEIDVVWIQKGSGLLSALFEVEHSTPIYSGLLRFNDIHLAITNPESRFNIVANDVRRDVFIRQLNRPTFKLSGLREICSFLEYMNVYRWYNRIKKYETNKTLGPGNG